MNATRTAQGITPVTWLRPAVDIAAAESAARSLLRALGADWLQEHLEPRGVGVLLEAEHLCMSLSGGSKPGVTTVTSTHHGLIRTDPRTRNEFLPLARAGR